MRFFKTFHYNSPAILTFALLSLGVLLLQNLTGDAATRFFAVYHTSWFSPMQYIRMFTSTLGHANLQHFTGNFLLILLIGPLLEERYGTENLIFMMLVTSLVKGILFIILSPAGAAAMGASGIVFMLILLASVTNIQKGRIPITLLLALAVYVGQDIWSHMFGPDSNISYLSHIFGGLSGAVLAFVVKPLKTPRRTGA